MPHHFMGRMARANKLRLTERDSATLFNTSGVIGNTPRVFKISFGVITQAGV